MTQGVGTANAEVQERHAPDCWSSISWGAGTVHPTLLEGHKQGAGTVYTTLLERHKQGRWNGIPQTVGMT